MNKNMLISAAFLSFFIVNASFSNDINMTNQTKFPARFSVSYGSCNPDKDIAVRPGKTARVGAGWCLIREISALVYKVPGGVPVTAKSFTSSGTGYRTFSIIENFDGSFAVIRP